MTLHTTSKGASELNSPQERVKYVVVGGSEVEVDTSIASHDTVHTHHGAMAVRCRAPVLSALTHLSMALLHTTSEGNSEITLSPKRVKYVVVGGSEVVDGTSVAPYET